MGTAMVMVLAFSASPVLAQVAPQEASSDASSAVSKGGEDTGSEIIVTAQSRSESLQKVPIAISAVAPETLRDYNILNIEGIKAQVPSMVFDRGVGFAQVFIRGIGTPFPNPGLEASVSTYIDGAYMARTFGTQFDLLDVQTVQTLKGPQGTLWGRNASGGVILINSADPELDAVKGRALAEYGNYDHFLAEGMLNVPLSETFGVRFAGRYSRDDGYLDNLSTGKPFGGSDTVVLRGKALFKPSSDFSAALTVDYSKKNFDIPIRVVGSNATCLVCQITGVPAVTGNDIRTTPLPRQYSKNFGANLRLNFTTGDVNILSVTAYRDIEGYANVDQDGDEPSLFNFNSRIGGKTFNQDITVSTDFGSVIDVTGGVSYLHDNGTNNSILTGAFFQGLVDAFGAFPETFNRAKTESISGFGEVYIRPVEGLTLTAGGRYTHDKRTYDIAINTSAQAALGNGPLANSQSKTFNAFTPRFVVAYDFGQVNVYASYNKGFKAGGFNTPAFTPPPPLRPEKMRSWEAGVKFNTLDNRLSGSLAVFDYKVKDLQVALVSADGAGQSIENAASAKGQGVEAELRFQVSPQLRLSGGVSYLDAKFVSYPNAPIFVLGPTGVVASFADLSGTRLPRAPKWSGFAAAEGKFEVGGNWLLETNVNARFSSDYDFSPGAGGPLLTDRQDDLFIVDASVNIGPIDGPFKLGAYVNNLTDKNYDLTTGVNPNGGILNTPAVDRTFGVRASYEF
jgi:iron complex outermembrane receptor protein